MENKVIDNITHLPSWMQFTILLLFTISLIIPTIIKIKNDNKISGKLINNEEKLGTLLDLLYSKFANNLSLEVSKEIIKQRYLITKYLVRDKVIELLKSHNYNEEGKFNKIQFKYDLIEYINNIYYEDSMFLGKLTCKTIKLNFYHTSKIKPEFIIDNITSFIEISNFKLHCSNQGSSCTTLDIYLNTFFQTISNKTLLQLEDIITKINSDYGN